MEDKLTIALSRKQRDLLLKYDPFFANHELFRLISIAVKKGKDYEIYLTEQELVDIIDQVSELANREENEKLQDKLDDLSDYLEELCDDFEDDDGDDDYSQHSQNTGSVCVLKVALADSGKIWRKIAVRCGQTLHDLHHSIFDAFDREDPHMYSFFFPHSPQKFDIRKIYQSSDEYTHPFIYEERGTFDREEVGDGSQTKIESLNLEAGQVFYYLFDFGDEWWHEITVDQMGQTADEGKYPRVIERKGQSPKQYDYPEDEEQQ